MEHVSAALILESVATAQRNGALSRQTACLLALSRSRYVSLSCLCIRQYSAFWRDQPMRALLYTMSAYNVTRKL